METQRIEAGGLCTVKHRALTVHSPQSSQWTVSACVGTGHVLQARQAALPKQMKGRGGVAGRRPRLACLSHLAGDQASLPRLRASPRRLAAPDRTASAQLELVLSARAAVCTAPSGLISPRPRHACPCSRISIPFPGRSGHGYMSICTWSACRRGHPRCTHPSHSFTTFHARPSGAGHFISLSLEPQRFLLPSPPQGDSRLHDQAEPCMYVPAGSHDIAVLAKPRFSCSPSPRSSRGTVHIVTRTTIQSRLSFGLRHGE